MTEVYEGEKQLIANGTPGNGNLMTSLVRASTGNASTTKTGKQMPNFDQDGLTESEIYGNFFVFNFEGHDTTAHTLAFAVVILAANPHVQDWVSEELYYVLGDQSPEDWDYATIFPRLKRCLTILVRHAHPRRDCSMADN
jgi:Cytochrome P450